MNNLDKDYLNLVKDVLENGYNKGDRTGTGTRSVFGRQIRHKMSDGFPLLTTKKMYMKGIVTELLWFLRGDTNIKYLVDNNCHIWDGDTYKNYSKKSETKEIWEEGGTMTAISPSSHYNFLSQEEFINKIKTNDEFAKKWGELGPIYGKQWRDWNGYISTSHQKMNGESGVHVKGIDQLLNSINLLKTDPDSRRNIVSAWNVGAMKDMVLPPCHNFFQFYTRELTAKERTALGSKGSTRLYDIIKEANLRTLDADVEMHKICNELNIPTRAISLMWNQRSVDTGLGLPFNIASYALLLELIGRMVNMVPDELIGNLGDVHLYNNHIEPIQEQLDREGYELPKIKFSNLVDIDIKKYIDKENMDLDIFISRLKVEDFILEDYQSHPTIKLPLSN